MPDNKPIYNKIIKALEDWIKYYDGDGSYAHFKTLENALDLITRLQAENKNLAETTHNLTLEKDILFDKTEELKAKVEKLNKEIQITKDAYTMLQTKIEIIKSEAIKEFAEKLKDSFFDNDYESPDIDFDYFVDNLVKEMVGENNA